MRRPVSIGLLASCLFLPAASSAFCDEPMGETNPTLANAEPVSPPDSGSSKGAFSRTRRLIDRLRKSQPDVRPPSHVPAPNGEPTRAVPMPLSRPKAELLGGGSELFHARPASPAQPRRARQPRRHHRHGSRRYAGAARPGGSRRAPGALEPGYEPSRAGRPRPRPMMIRSPRLEGSPSACRPPCTEPSRAIPTWRPCGWGIPPRPSAEPSKWLATSRPPSIRPLVRPPADHADPPRPVRRRRTAGPARLLQFGQFYFYLSLRQPVELGHQTTHRYHIAKAAFKQQKWTVIQAELLALIQTYRFFQTAAYRRERLKIARELADFNDRLLKTLERRLEANQVPAADVSWPGSKAGRPGSSSRRPSKTTSRP